MEDTNYIRTLSWEATYHAALHPRHVRLMLAMAGVETETARVCCDLAYGQGLSLVLHAACNQEIAWSGTDFNPQHAAAAKAFQGAQVLPNLALRDQPLSAYCDTVPAHPFDVITCTGTWSWLPERDQTAIAAFASRHLSARGALAFDHMTLPGQATTTSLRHLLLTLAAKRPNPPPADWPNAVIAEALEICEAQARFFHDRDNLRGLLHSLLKSPAEILIHEYFNHHWQPRHLTETAAFLTRHGLCWAGVLNAADGVDDLNLTPRQIATLTRVEEPVQREQLKDFLVDRAMRTDLWMRTSISRDSGACRDLIADMSVVLVSPIVGLAQSAKGALGTVALSEAVYRPLLAALADHQPMPIGTLHARTRETIAWRDLCEALLILIDRDMIQTANPDPAAIAKSAKTSRTFNTGLLERARTGRSVDVLGSPVTGQGLKVPRLHQLFMLAEMEGGDSPEALAIAAAGQRQDDETHDLPAEARRYIRQARPVYAALGIAGAAST